MIERDIWLAANQMISLFGDDAAVHAAIRADTLRDRDDQEGYADWKRVGAAIDELTRIEPYGLVN